ncbi:MAG: hypothetical protein LAP21_14710 [Acidobacteriia bacterium]|nr:hypothetical protein [Terriglobia bacterium]
MKNTFSSVVLKIVDPVKETHVRHRNWVVRTFSRLKRTLRRLFTRATSSIFLQTNAIGNPSGRK